MNPETILRVLKNTCLRSIIKKKEAKNLKET